MLTVTAQCARTRMLREQGMESPSVLLNMIIIVLGAQVCRLFATPWTEGCQAPLSMEFSSA